MTTVKLTDATWLLQETQRVKGVLLAQLPKDGLPQAAVKHMLEDLGFNHTVQEWNTIAQNLQADGTIEILP